MQGDSARLMQVLDNLLSNALKFTPARGRVDVRLYASEERAVLEVEDTGLGLADDEQERLFERFFRELACDRERDSGHGPRAGDRQDHHRTPRRRNRRRERGRPRHDRAASSSHCRGAAPAGRPTSWPRDAATVPRARDFRAVHADFTPKAARPHADRTDVRAVASVRILMRGLRGIPISAAAAALAGACAAAARARRRCRCLRGARCGLPRQARLASSALTACCGRPAAGTDHPGREFHGDGEGRIRRQPEHDLWLAGLRAGRTGRAAVDHDHSGACAREVRWRAVLFVQRPPSRAEGPAGRTRS